jgi:hypothetical protein
MRDMGSPGGSYLINLGSRVQMNKNFMRDFAQADKRKMINNVSPFVSLGEELRCTFKTARAYVCALVTGKGAGEYIRVAV